MKTPTVYTRDGIYIATCRLTYLLFTMKAISLATLEPFFAADSVSAVELMTQRVLYDKGQV